MPTKERYGGLKKVNESSSDKNTPQKEKKDGTGEAKKDGKPHKARSGVINLSDEVSDLEKRNRRKIEKLKRKSKKQGNNVKNLDLSELDNADPNYQEGNNQKNAIVYEKKETKLKELLKENEDYKEIEFKIPITLDLPPRKALRNVEDFFDLDVHEELGNIIKEKIFELINKEEEEFEEILYEQIEKHLYPRGRPNKK